MEKFFYDKVLTNLITPSKFYLALHFYESVIFSLVKRREAVTKKNLNLMKELDTEEVNEDPKEVNQTNEKNELFEINEVKEETKNNINNGVIEEESALEKPDDNDKTVSFCPEAMDVEKTESIIPSANNSDKKKKPNKVVKNLREKANKEVKEKTTIKKENNNLDLNKRKRSTVPRETLGKDWRETCYICTGYGDLICCDGCTNVAHLFCACLEVFFKILLTHLRWLCATPTILCSFFCNLKGFPRLTHWDIT